MAQTGLDNLRLLGMGKSFRAELAAMIEEMALFSDLAWNEIEILADYMQAYEAAKGCAIFSEGEAGNFMCLLVKGKVDVVKEDSHGTQKVVATVSSGKALGEMALIDNEPRSARAVAVEVSTLLLLTRENFNRILHDHPRLASHLAVRLARLLSQRLRQTSGMLVDYLG